MDMWCVADQGDALGTLKLLADDTRWRLMGELRSSDRQVGELVSRLQLAQNLVSYHLGVLRQAGLVQVRHSDSDARALYYRLDLAVLQSRYQEVGVGMGLPSVVRSVSEVLVFFLCTGNSARSQMAEGWLRRMSGGRVLVRSAGTQPRVLHPLAVQVMAEAGVDIGYQRAKGVDAMGGLAPRVVVTVCDLAREQCPEWSGEVVQVHWSVPDPVRVVGDVAVQVAAFRAVRDELRERVEGLLALLPGLMGR